jgi:hypothetical protein
MRSSRKRVPPPLFPSRRIGFHRGMVRGLGRGRYGWNTLYTDKKLKKMKDNKLKKRLSLFLEFVVRDFVSFLSVSKWFHVSKGAEGCQPYPVSPTGRRVAFV